MGESVMKVLVPTAAAALLAFASVEAVAQQNVSGQWQCQHANRTVSNNAFENWIYEFALALNTNGTFQAQGNYNAQTNGFAVGFYAEGKWSQQQGAIAAQGQQQQQGGTSGPFYLLFTNVTDREMSNQYESANGRLLTYCRR
jgi:hypothetical protein